jgi:hypothetical protein
VPGRPSNLGPTDLQIGGSCVLPVPASCPARKHLLKSGYNEVAVEKVFAKLDIDGDGEITPEELRQGFLQYTPLRSAPGLGAYNSQFVDEIHEVRACRTDPPAPACTRLHPPAPACTRLHPPAPACTRLHPPAPACTRLHPPAPACTRLHAPARARARLHAPAPACTRLHPLAYSLAHAQPPMAAWAQDADTLFNSIDVDGSGEISKEELREHLKTFTKYSFKVSRK